MTKDKLPLRIERSRPHLHMLAQLLYILDQPEPRDYIILMAVKYARNMYDYAKMELIRTILSISEEDFYESIERMREKGWVAVQGEYIKEYGAGDKKLDEATGWVSYALHNIQERKPLDEWMKVIKK